MHTQWTIDNFAVDLVNVRGNGIVSSKLSKEIKAKRNIPLSEAVGEGYHRVSNVNQRRGLRRHENGCSVRRVTPKTYVVLADTYGLTAPKASEFSRPRAMRDMYAY